MASPNRISRMWFGSSATEAIHSKQVRKQKTRKHMKKKGMLEDITAISLVIEVLNQNFVFVKKLTEKHIATNGPKGTEVVQ